jgi:hypothetical protein
MEPKGPLSCSQQPATKTYLSQMNLLHTLRSYSFKIHFNIILLLIPTSQSAFFFSGSLTKILYVFLM